MPLLLPVLLGVLTLLGAGTATADDRRAYSANDTPWLAAVGKLQVPGTRYREGRREYVIEDCTATLVSRPGRARANTLVTAWHCLEAYDDLSRPIQFTLHPDSPQAISAEAFVLASGGSMQADWAVLRLRTRIASSDVQALQVADSPDIDTPVMMAGYSKDTGLGAGGQRLTFDPHCRITTTGGAEGETDCMAFKGASGGPLLQADSQGGTLVYGIISAGDGQGLSTYIPVADFRHALDRAL